MFSHPPLEFFPRDVKSWSSPGRVQFQGVVVVLIAIICRWIYVLSCFCGTMVSRGTLFVDGDPWICLTVTNFVSFRIARWVRASRSSYSSLLGHQVFCNSVFIPPGSSSPPVESSNSPSLATRRNSFLYSLTDRLPCFKLLSLILASPLASITSNCLCYSVFNPAQLSQVGVIRYAAYGVIHVPPSSLSRLVAERIFSSSWLCCHPTVL